MKRITQKSLIESTSISAALVRATVRQCGGWDNFTERARDVVNHGAAGGFSGWIYYTETVVFTRRNRAAIAALCESTAKELGDGGAVALVRGFNCLKGDYTESEVARTLYGKGDGEQIVANALAWFALEETARAYADLIERDD
jgi:hypothetical protein